MKDYLQFVLYLTTTVVFVIALFYALLYLGSTIPGY